MGGRTKRSTLGQGAYDGPPSVGSGERELIVVTLLAAAEGPLKLGRVTSREELSTALAK